MKEQTKFVVSTYNKRRRRMVSLSVDKSRIGEDEFKTRAEEFMRKNAEDNTAFEEEKRLTSIRSEVEREVLNKQEGILGKMQLNEITNELSRDTGWSIFIIARSRVGKSHLIARLVNRILEWDSEIIPIIFAGNPNSEPYRMIKQRVAIFSGFRPSVVETLKIVNDLQPADRKYKFLLILDDILEARHSETLRNICLSYRNSFISAIISLQSPVLVQRNVRNNAAGYFIGQTTGQESEGVMDKFLKYMPYFRRIKTNDARLKQLNEVTKNHQFLCHFPLRPDDELYGITAPP